MQLPDLVHLDLSILPVDEILCLSPYLCALLVLFEFSNQELPKYDRFHSNLPSQIAPRQEKDTLLRHISHQQIVILGLHMVQQNWHSLLALLSAITEA